MAKKPLVYAVQISDTAPEQGVSLVSFVETPAIGVNFVTLSAEQPLHVALKADTKKQILTGPVLIPDLKIARLAADKKSVYYITFSADVIEQLRDRFHEQNNTQATNLQHETPLEGNYVVESWIIEDETQDKATKLGFEGLPVGTWMASYKVPDAKLWADEVETGNVKGFSMEGLLGYTTLSHQVSMQKNPKPAGKMAAFFNSLKKLVTDVTLATLTLDDDSTVEVDDETGEVFTLDEEGARGELLADGTYKLADGSELVVKDGKKVDATSEKKDDEELAATALDAGDYALPGGDVLTITENAYSIAKADGSEELSAVNVKLESISMADGSTMELNPITRRLTTADGKMVESGYYACADGSYFEVSTSQYTYQIDKATYDKVQKLSAVEVKLADAEKTIAGLQTKLKAKPAAAPVKLAGDKGAEKLAEQEKPLTPGQVLLARSKATHGLK